MNLLNLREFIYLLEREIGKNAIKEYEEIKPGDVKETKADNSILQEWIGTYPKTFKYRNSKIYRLVFRILQVVKNVNYLYFWVSS